ncbi:tRNA ligase [Komagataella phaffii CBS 7435]|uniref:tRNA ligase n=1 Tax=Komagataella phaffii (strain ATCC 76273 / CBS 7435 / CECT 11047 / NRRL Y-11430 / Wegner 21-1) TaxID=981350 RepID=F2QVW0_KOMPC|nr:GQ67_03704T0 [Komagataella phaffii]AOA68773.1 GQ68_03676T0 [Komagataella phaffii GS115]CAH2449558.1 tRNA ligase [Komagataella phaffii CBS 7435]CCA39538.1 tRNA ligase [Komagataella phaffii CBS 7435]
MNLPIEPLVLSEKERNEDTNELVTQLKLASLRTNKQGKAHHNEFTIFDSDITLDGWRFNEFDYAKTKISLPTNARGLFTKTYKDGTSKIITRGYDKFFNVNEVLPTRPDWILKNTIGPYEVTLKENGCIIFVSGLQDGTIIVSSKNSTGDRTELSRNHAKVGQEYLLKQLKENGIAAESLAKSLYELNVTAVAEYCDDEFEEHVLEYPKDKAGLFLHGLNVNKPVFKSYPMEQVCKFADAFGFNKVEYLMKDNSAELFEFLDGCSTTGTYNGREIEGFVIRCKLKDSGRTFFFKYKFEEPYLLYRQLRELTRMLIKGKSVREMRITKHKKVSLEYLSFIKPLLVGNTKLSEEFLQGHGIIALRKLFLQHCGMKGYEIANEEDTEDERMKELELQLSNISLTDAIYKFVIVNVAVIGCGKTTTSIMLSKLLPKCGHVQSDNITKPVKDKLTRMALETLRDHDMVIIDRGNHLLRERKQIFDEFEDLYHDYLPINTKFKFVCLNYVSNKNSPELWNLTRSRIIERGDNHQTIKAETQGVKFAESIMKGFINRFQPVDVDHEPDSKFNVVIDLEVHPNNSSKSNAVKVVNTLIEYYPEVVSPVSDEKIEHAFQDALDHKPELTIKVGKAKTKKVKPAYVGIGLSDKDKARLMDAIEQLFARCAAENNQPVDMSTWVTLKQLGRIPEKLHVTLAHIASTRDKKLGKIWNRYTNEYFSKFIQEMNKKLPDDLKGSLQTLPNTKAHIRLKSLCISEKLACVEVDIEGIINESQSITVESTNKYPHITLGTVDQTIPAVESNILLQELISHRGSSETPETPDDPAKTQISTEEESCNRKYLYTFPPDILFKDLNLFLQF